MRFTPTDIDGCFVVDVEPRDDERGSFARVFCTEELAANRTPFSVVQANLATTTRAGTVRGLHYQLPPAAEAKLVRAVRGALYDVVLDMRVGSPSFGRWFAATLRADDRRALLVPEGCAHGYQALEDDTDALYLSSSAYDGAQERGVHHADPLLAIDWPLPATGVSAKDAALPAFADAPHVA